MAKKILNKQAVATTTAIIILVIIVISIGAGYWYYTTTISPPPPDTITLRFNWPYSEYITWGQEVADTYMAANPNIEIIVENIADPQLQIDAWAVAGTIPDIMIANQMMASGWYEKGYIEPLDDYWATYEDNDKYLPGTIEMATYKEQLMFLPQTAGGVGVAFRKDLVEAAGYNVADIDTWDKWIEVLLATVNQGEGLYGVPLPLADAFMGGAWFAQAAISNGIDLTDVARNLEEDEAKFIEVFEFIDKLSKLGLLAPDSYAYEFPDTGIAWGTEVTVSVMIGSFVRGMLGDQTQFITPETIDAVAFPAGPSGQPYWQAIISGFWISSASENKDAAWDFITYLNNQYNNGMATARMHDTTRSDVTADYRIATFPDYAEGWWITMWFNAMAPNIWDKHSGPGYEPNYSIFQDVMVKVGQGILTPEAAFAELKTRLLDAIAG